MRWCVIPALSWSAQNHTAGSSLRNTIPVCLEDRQWPRTRTTYCRILLSDYPKTSAIGLSCKAWFSIQLRMQHRSFVGRAPLWPAGEAHKRFTRLPNCIREGTQREGKERREETRRGGEEERVKGEEKIPYRYFSFPTSSPGQHISQPRFCSP